MANETNVIDGIENDDHTIDYDFSHGFNFSSTARVLAGIISFLLSIIVLKSIYNIEIISIIFFSVLLFLSLFVLLSYMGVQLSVSTKYYKEYAAFFGVKKGNWRSTRGLTDVAVLTIRNKKQYKSTFGASSSTVEDVETGVYFLIPSHRKRVLIKKCKTKIDADNYAEELASRLNKNFTIFNPKVSEASKAKRYH